MRPINCRAAGVYPILWPSAAGRRHNLCVILSPSDDQNIRRAAGGRSARGSRLATGWRSSSRSSSVCRRLAVAGWPTVTVTPDTWAEKNRKFRTDKFDMWNKRNFHSCMSCRRLVSSRSRKLEESKPPFVSRIEFILSKLLNFSAHVSGVNVAACSGVGWWWIVTPYTWAEKFESFERINSIRETNGSFDSCNSCKRLVPSRLHELHESKFPFVSRIEFIRSKLSNFSAHVYGVSVGSVNDVRPRPKQPSGALEQRDAAAPLRCRA